MQVGACSGAGSMSGCNLASKSTKLQHTWSFRGCVTKHGAPNECTVKQARDWLSCACFLSPQWHSQAPSCSRLYGHFHTLRVLIDTEKEGVKIEVLTAHPQRLTETKKPSLRQGECYYEAYECKLWKCQGQLEAHSSQKTVDTRESQVHSTLCSLAHSTTEVQNGF